MFVFSEVCIIRSKGICINMLLPVCITMLPEELQQQQGPKKKRNPKCACCFGDMSQEPGQLRSKRKRKVEMKRREK